jgi:hypothetical protein
VLGSHDGSPFPVEGNWSAVSPTLRRLTQYDDEELEMECARMAAEAQHSGRFTVGQSLYHQLPLCANPLRVIHPDAVEWRSDWRLSKALGVPVAATLGEIPADYAEAALIIEHETQAALRHGAKQ